MNAGEEPVPSAAPGPGLLAASVGALLLPVLLAALFASLPGIARIYVLKLPLPLLAVECALLFGVLVLPLFAAPPADRVNPGLTGLLRGGLLALTALPFVLVARVVAPVPLGAVLTCCLLVGVTGAGAGATAAAFRSRGLAAAITLMSLPALLGFLATDVYPRLEWLTGLSPFYAAHSAMTGSGGWWPGFLPGLALLAVGFAVRGRGSPGLKRA